jgi:hypothetical protein
MESNVFYKVVSKKNGKLVSAWISTHKCYSTIAIVQYKVNKWVGRRKNCGPMAVFLWQEDAIHFRKWFCPDGFIYTCRIKPSHKHILWITLPNGDKTYGTSMLNTVYANKVKLLKRCCF